MLNNSIKHFTDFFESNSRNLVKLVCIWLCKKVKCYYKYFWIQCYIYWAEYYTHSLLLYTYLYTYDWPIKAICSGLGPIHQFLWMGWPKFLGKSRLMFHYMESENRQNIKFRAGCLYNYRAIVAFRRPLSYKQMDRGKKLSSSSSYKRNFDKFSPINLMSGGFWLVRAKNDTAFARSRTSEKTHTRIWGLQKLVHTALYRHLN